MFFIYIYCKYNIKMENNKEKMGNKILFNFRIHKELYEYLSKISKQQYTTMTQYLIDIITKDKEANQINGDYYVYVYLDPRKNGKFIYDNLKFDFEPFYVGKGKGNRIEQGLHDNNNNINKQQIISEIFNDGLKPICLKICENISNEKSYELEKELIQKIGRLNENSVLTNVTKGSTSYKRDTTPINRYFYLKHDKIKNVFAVNFIQQKYELDDGSLINEKLFLDLFEPNYNNLYYLRSNDKYVVSIEDKDDTYFKLSDGCTIPQILFYQIFKQVEKVDPQKFFGVNKSPVEKMRELGKETLPSRSDKWGRIANKIKIEKIHSEPEVKKGPPTPPKDRIIREGEIPIKPNTTKK